MIGDYFCDRQLKLQEVQKLRWEMCNQSYLIVLIEESHALAFIRHKTLRGFPLKMADETSPKSTVSRILVYEFRN